MSFFKKLLRRKRPKGIDGQVGIRILSEADAILRGIGIRPWLTDGTVLGYFREGSFIGHDIDMDLGCLVSEYDNEIIPQFVEKGWVCNSIFGTRECGLEFSFVKEDTKLDIFFFYAEQGNLWHGAWRPIGRSKRNLIKYYYDPFELVEKEFLSSRFWIPRKRKSTLRGSTERAGENRSWIGTGHSIRLTLSRPRWCSPTKKARFLHKPFDKDHRMTLRIRSSCLLYNYVVDSMVPEVAEQLKESHGIDLDEETD